MCRLAWQLLDMLGNVLGRPRHTLQRPRHACNVLDVLGMHFCKYMEVWWYTTLLTSQLIRQQVGKFSSMWNSKDLAKMHAKDVEDVASMPRTLQSMPRTVKNVAKHA